MKGITRSLAVLGIAGLSTVAGFAATPPNVVFVMADDVGPGDIEVLQRRFSGDSLIATPALDRLIEEGISFANARTPASLCAPTRWAVMTGNYNYRSHRPWGIWGAFAPNRIADDQLTLGRVMQRAGYATAFFGKWGFGSEWNRKGSDAPYRGNPYGRHTGNGFSAEAIDLTRIVGGGASHLGFDTSLTLPSGIQNLPYAVYRNDEWMPLAEDSELRFLDWRELPKDILLGKSNGDGDSAWDPRRVSGMLAEAAVEFIGRHAGERPFFIYFCSETIHHPHTPPETLNGRPVAGTTPSRHLDMVHAFDAQIEMLVEALKANGVYDDTLLVVTSDNGGMAENNAVADTVAAGHDSTAGLRSDKGSIYEGGHRVPFIAVWPGRIAPGSESDEPVMVQDMLATLAALTGQQLREDDAMDSLNLLPLMTAEPGAKGHAVMVVQGSADHGCHTAIIEDGWKLVVETKKSDPSFRRPIALFNLDDNPLEEESRNRVKDPAHIERVTQLMRLNGELRDGLARTTPLP